MAIFQWLCDFKSARQIFEEMGSLDTLGRVA